MKKSASILDYSYPFLDPAVWDQDMKLHVYQKDFLLRLINKMYETYKLKQPELWVLDIYVIGSLTTSKWLFTSDMDVHIKVNLEAFIASNQPGFSKDEAFTLLDSIRLEFDRAKILAPMTQHPAEFYFEAPEFIKTNVDMVGMYSLTQDKWLKDPILFEADLDFEESKKDVLAQAEALAESLDASFGKITRQIDRINELDDVIHAWDASKQQLFYAKIEAKLKAIEAEIAKDMELKQQLVDERHSAQNPMADVEIKFKWLQRFEFFGILNNLKILLKQTDGQITPQELPLIKKIINEGSLKEAFLKEAFEKKTIMVDFDNTIAKENEDHSLGKLMEGAKEALTKLMDDGYEIIIDSARANDEEGADEIKEYLEKHDIPYDSIYSGYKPIAWRYIDDRAIKFDSWADALKQVEKSEKKASLRIVAGGIELPVIDPKTFKRTEPYALYIGTGNYGEAGKFDMFNVYGNHPMITKSNALPTVGFDTLVKQNIPVIGKEPRAGAAVPAQDISSIVKQASIERVNVSPSDTNPTGSTNVLVNPTIDELSGLANRCESHQVRGLIDPNTGYLYAWDAYAAIHQDIIDALGLDINYNDIRGVASPYILHFAAHSIGRLLDYQQEVRDELTQKRASLKQAQTKKVKQGNYSCAMALVPHDLAQEIVEWGVRNVPDDKVYLDGDKFGRELESHITIKYGLLTNNGKHVRRSFNDSKPFKARLGKVRHFQPPELPFDVLTVEVISKDLEKANKNLTENFKCATDLPSDEYKPHITISYMKRDTAKDYIGSDVFEGKELELDTIIFSPRKGNRTYFNISQDKESTWDFEQLNKTASHDIGYWVDPSGNIYDSHGEGLIHNEWIAANLGLLRKQYHINIPDYAATKAEVSEYFNNLNEGHDNVDQPDMSEIWMQMLQQGWIRVGDADDGIGVELNDFRRIPSFMDGLLAEDLRDGDIISVENIDRQMIKVQYPFKSLQQAVNQALVGKRKKAEFLPSLFNAPDNEWQFEHGGDDKEIAVNPDPVSDETTWYAPCTEGKPRTKEVWRQFISMFSKAFSKNEMNKESIYDPQQEEIEKNELGEDQTLLEYQKNFKDLNRINTNKPKTNWDETYQDLEPSKPLPVTYSPQISNEDNLDQNSPGGYPRRFMGKPKGEWTSNEGEVNKTLIDMLKNRAAAINFITKEAGSYSSTYTDEQGEQFYNEQHNNDTDEEPYVNHDQRDYPYGMHDSPENTGMNIGWPKDNTRAVVRLDTLENPAYRHDPFGIGEYNVTWYMSLPADNGMETVNPD
ncbi:MAG: 2'-5' RNA ligase family protein [bacterium]